MSKSRRYHSTDEFNAEIDRLNALFPVLEEKAKLAKRLEEQYWLAINEHREAWETVYKDRELTKKESDEKWATEPFQVFKKLKRAAKRAKGAIGRNEKAILKLKNGLAEFQTETMPFLEDRSVEVK